MASTPEFVAVKAIDHGLARAFNPGDPVPASNVKAHGYDKAGLVARTGTKAAEQALDRVADEQDDAGDPGNVPGDDPQA